MLKREMNGIKACFKEIFKMVDGSKSVNLVESKYTRKQYVVLVIDFQHVLLQNLKYDCIRN